MKFKIVLLIILLTQVIEVWSVYPTEGINYNKVLRDAEQDVRTLGNSVGVVDGVINIGPTGATNYTIPIYTSPGTNGHTPNVSLAYSSQAGNGIVGMGWNITGMSSITRSAKNMYEDGTSTKIKFKFSEWPKLSYDGQSMVQTAGGYDLNAEFEIKSTKSIKIIPLELASNGEEYKSFKVITKEGMTIEYGKTDDSRLMNGAYILSWLKNKVIDINGNYIDYVYEQNNGEIWLKEIKYTGKIGGQSPYASIKFHYKLRDDKNVLFEQGEEYLSTLLLDKITSEYEGQTIRTYNLTYRKYLYSVLRQVELVGENNSKLNSTLFDYDYQEKTDLELSVKQIDAHNIDNDYADWEGRGDGETYYHGDFNGDGIQDRIVVEGNVDYINTSSSSHDEARWYVQTGKYYECDGSEDCGNISYDNKAGNLYQFTTVDHLDGQYPSGEGHHLLRENVIIADFNNDGFDDILIPWVDGYSECWNGKSADFSKHGTAFENLKMKVFINNADPNDKYFNSTETREYKLQNNRLNGDDYGNIYEQFIPGDYNGDGYIDLIISTKQIDVWGGCNSLGWDGSDDYLNAYYINFFKSDGTLKDDGVNSGSSIDSDLLTEFNGLKRNKIIDGADDEGTRLIPFGGVKNRKTEVLIIDNGNVWEGLSELMWWTDNNEGDLGNGTMHKYLSRPEPIAGTGIKHSTPLGINLEKKNSYFPGDYNGDGYSDLLYWDKNDSDWKIIYWTESGFTEETVFSSMGSTRYYENDDNKIFIGDFNGDGKSDICTYSLELKSFKDHSVHPDEVCPQSIADGERIRIYPGDDMNHFDSGGTLTCMLSGTTYYERDVKYTLYLMNGATETTAGTSTKTLIPNFEKYEKQYLNLGINDPKILGIQSVRASYTSYSWFGLVTNVDTWDLHRQGAHTLDYNGDGKADIYNYNGNHSIISFFSDEGKCYLNKVTDGFNNVTKINYETITREHGENITDAVYTSNHQTSPIKLVKGGMYVVTSVDNYKPGESTVAKTITYKYEDAIMHKYKGFLGFKKNEYIIDDHKGTSRVVSENELETTKYNLLPHKTLVYRGTELISETILENQLYTYSNDRYFNYISEIKEIDYINPGVTITQNTFNIAQNLLETYKRLGPDENTIIKYTKTTNTYIDVNGDGWYNELISTAVEMAHSDDDLQNPVTGYKSFEYWNASGNYLPKKITTYRDGYNYYEEIFYDLYGNVIQVTASHNKDGGNSRTNYIDYDSKGRFRTSSWNSLFYTNSWTYDNKYGKILTETDINNLTITHSYDDIGRYESTLDYLGNTASSIARWSNANDPIDPDFEILTVVEKSGTNSLTSYQYFDSWNVNVMAESESYSTDPNNIIKVRQKNYFNWDGSINKTSGPYFSNSTPTVFSEYEYDEYFRTTELRNNFDGDIIKTNKSYDIELGSRLVEVIDNVKRNTFQKFNSAGDLIESVDQAGYKVQYKYHNNGNIREVKTILGDEEDLSVDSHIITLVYNQDGLQTQLIDGDAGVFKYFYNGFGTIYKEENPEGITELEFDAIGRIKKETKTKIDDMTVNIVDYQYKETGYGLGQIEKIIGPGNLKSIFYYDSKSRVNKVDEEIDGSTYTTEYFFTSDGRIHKEKYLTGVEIEYVYDNNTPYQSLKKGILTTIKRIDVLPEQVIWQLNSIDEYGTLRSYSLSDGNMVSSYDYDKFRNLTDIKTATGGQYIQHLNYKTDYKTGRLEYRKDVLLNQKESFSYDILNRLKTASVGNHIEKTNYYKDGSIKSKSNPKIYTYNYGNQNKDNVFPNHSIKELNASEVLSSMQLKYTSFNSVEEITECDYKYEFTYGAEEQRRKMTFYESGIKQYDKYYLRNVEKTVYANGDIKIITYLPGGNGITASVVENDIQGTVTEDTYYIHTDHLGSIYSLTKPDGVKIDDAIFSFDAWGNLRNAKDWTDNSISTETRNYFDIMSRGFTSHEHLTRRTDYSKHLHIINMNGRIYDPMLGQFMQADNFVSDPSSSQGYNRFTYVYNNPLSFSDPSGEEPFTMIGLIVLGGTLTYNTARAYNNYGADAAIKTFAKGILLAAATMGVASGVSAVLGELVGAMGGTVGANAHWAANMAFSTAVGVTTTAIMSGATTGKFTISQFKTSLAMSLVFGALKNLDKINKSISSAVNAIKNYIPDLISSIIPDMPSLNTSLAGMNIGGFGTAFEDYYDGTSNDYVDNPLRPGLQKPSLLTMVINRIVETKYSTLSTWVIVGTTLKGYILESGGPSTSTPNTRQRIPAGTYEVEYRTSTHFDSKMLFLKDVPGRSGIMLHWGCYPSNTTGCLMPGTTKGFGWDPNRNVKGLEFLRAKKHFQVFGNTRNTYYTIRDAFLKHGIKNVRVQINEIPSK